MKIQLKRAFLFDQAILLFIYLQLTILAFFNLNRLMNKVIAVFIIVSLLIKKKQRGYLLNIAIVLLGLFTISSLFGEQFDLSNIKSNFLVILYPILYVFYIAHLCKNAPDLIDGLLDKGFWIFNGTILLNIVVLCIQIIYPNSIVAVSDLVINYWQDTVSGLFRYGGTHELCLFTTFIILYNLSYAQTHLQKRNAIHAYTVMITVISAVIALQNDNKSFFLVLPLALLVYYTCNTKYTYTKLGKFIEKIVFVVVLAVAVYALVPQVRMAVNKRIVYIAKAFSMGSASYGGNERIAIIGYSLSRPTTWAFGVGLGTATIFTDEFHGFRHFGQSNFGSILLLGGVWFFAVLVFLYIQLQKTMIRYSKGKGIISIALTVFLVFLSIYTACFVDVGIVICWGLITLAIRMRMQQDAVIMYKKIS